ncbi:hypothetical protein PpBr36_01552 [Pyricularia pennisetigena]|uniref:hypothetical protein n=1 Tax=Pyricularia pennisetigena TaxID=1578925 RepID=UPI001153E01D|nr:hypothetical protein PpBr36_01552 [Pyricularia pennisetigena]TLS29342.1 hypothetical protein PpBr36_01552 [Pyricularia pennisetigena]
MNLWGTISGFALALFWAGAAQADPIPILKPDPIVPAGALQARQTITPGGAPCGEHGPTNRRCWKNNWNVSTDYEGVIPTGTTRTFDLYITNVSSYAGADGVAKPVMLINGAFPGPAIQCDWGDWLELRVHNQLRDNGTGIHWHGMHQLNSNNQDGANGVTECPIPPGSSRSYTFRAVNYGSSWFHSHFSTQYGNGVVGSVIVHGPASANYDVDLGPYIITDWYHETADRLQLRAETGGPPVANNIVFNGTNINPKGSGGRYNRVKLTRGKKHRLRIINTSVDVGFTVSLVGHNFTVIATDLVPVEPIVKSQLFLGVGQRYDVIIDANQPVANYWFNATLGGGGRCGTTENPFPASIFEYEGAPSSANPTNRGTPITADCRDSTGFAPVVKRVAPRDQFAAQFKELPVDVTQVLTTRGTVFHWLVNGSAIDVEWDKPILQYVAEKNTSWPRAANVVSMPKRNVWTFWVINNLRAGLPHPIHLHGHDLLLLGTGESGTFDGTRDVGLLNFNNPVRRDVAMLPGGWMVLAFETKNPGAWLMHCHIGWHVSQGLSVQFLELPDEIPNVMKLDQVQPTCEAWRRYWPTAAYPKLDSGLRR